jgi:hypothetical protein
MSEWQLSCHALKILQANIFHGDLHCGKGWPPGREGKNFSPLSPDRKLLPGATRKSDFL